MSTTDVETQTIPVDYRIQDAVIAEMRDRLAGLKADSKDGYEAVRMGIAEVRTLRVAVEKRRKDLKRDALEYGRRVDHEANRITKMLEAIEDPLKLEKQRVDDEKRRIQAEIEAEERRIQEEAKAAERAAEEARLNAEAERVRAELEAQRAEMMAAAAAEAERLAEERRKLQAEREQIAKERARQQAESEELARQVAAKQAEELRQRQQREAEERRLREEANRLAMAPDRDKIRAWLNDMQFSANAPTCATAEANEMVAATVDRLDSVCRWAMNWCQ